MKQDDMIESKYLRQSDFPEPRVVTIAEVKKVNMAAPGEIPEYKWTVLFAEFPKAMALNVTNLKRLFKYCGEDSDDWEGKKVTVMNDPDVEFKGEIVGGLRVKSPPATVRGSIPKARSLDDANAELAAGVDPRDVPF